MSRRCVGVEVSDLKQFWNHMSVSFANVVCETKRDIAAGAQTERRGVPGR
jgi:hypothetical protein